MIYLCGVTLSSTNKGQIKNVGFYDMERNLSYKITVLKNREIFSKKYSLKMDRSKFNLKEFKNEYKFVTPISEEFWNKVKNVNHVNSIDYKDLLKHFDLTEWLL